MTDDGWKSPSAVTVGAMTMFAYNLCVALVEKGVLTQAEASHILVKTADDIRTGSEDGPGQPLGDEMANVFEKLASWLHKAT